METKSPIYAQAKEFAEGVHAVYPDKWLAYNVSRVGGAEKSGLLKLLADLVLSYSSRLRSTGMPQSCRSSR